jgi:hypothetical protein
MKELSIEEKAKAYDKAIERAKSLIGDTIIEESGQHIAEVIFPELKESEDEKIRKEMIFYFTEEIPQCSIQEHSDKMREFISWLKRQEVERTKLELKAGSSYFCYKSRWERADSETFKKGLIYMCNKDGVLDNFVIKNPEQHFIEIKDERIAWLEKQGEQKPAEWSEEDEKIRQTIINEFEQCSEWCCSNGLTKEDCINWLKKQEYFKWDDEDNENMNSLCVLLDQMVSINAIGNEHSIEYKNWLKSLKTRVQPKQEWSEGDEDLLFWTINNLTELKNRYGKNYGKSGKCIDWLKALKQRIGG